jgi:hypothetical protein
LCPVHIECRLCQDPCPIQMGGKAGENHLITFATTRWALSGRLAELVTEVMALQSSSMIQVFVNDER